jgi:hypothetical protein
VPALVDGEARPDHHVRGRRPDLLVAPRAPVRLRRRDAGQPAHDPLLAPSVDLRQLEPTREANVAFLVGGHAGRRPAGGSGSARAHTRQVTDVQLSDLGVLAVRLLKSLASGSDIGIGGIAPS